MKKEIRLIDGQGRVTLGKSWASKVVSLDINGSVITIREQVVKNVNEGDFFDS